MPRADDDPEKWIFREHTKAKHEVLRKYLIPWTNKLTSYNKRSGQYNKIRIFDCFAGRGEYTRVEDTEQRGLEHIDVQSETYGSPQIILDRLTDRSDQFEEAQIICIENNQTNYEFLEDNITGIRDRDIADNINFRLENSSFEDVVLDLVDETGGNKYPSLFFIDPFGFSSLDYDVITQIGSTPQFEFLITFMYRDMNRFLENADHQDSLNLVFGTEDWQDELEEYDPENWEALVEYYTTRLEESGPDYTFEYLISEPNTRQTIYYLVFGSNSWEGLHTIREVSSHCGTGRFMYAPRRPEYQREQRRLFDSKESTKIDLLEMFEGMRYPFNRIVRICSRERKYIDATESDYREALHELEEEGKVEIERITSEERGIQGEDMVNFKYLD